jgi:hypothetical protein
MPDTVGTLLFVGVILFLLVLWLTRKQEEAFSNYVGSLLGAKTNIRPVQTGRVAGWQPEQTHGLYEVAEGFSNIRKPTKNRVANWQPEQEHGLYETEEGFAASMGTVPAAKQASMIPADVAGATTVNPDVAKPEFRDWVSAKDSFQYFLDVYSAAAARSTGASQAEIQATLRTAPVDLAAIETYILEPESVPSRDVLARGQVARRLADAMRRVGPMDPHMLGPQETPSTVVKGLANDDLMAA